MTHLRRAPLVVAWVVFVACAAATVGTARADAAPPRADACLVRDAGSPCFVRGVVRGVCTEVSRGKSTRRICAVESADAGPNGAESTGSAGSSQGRGCALAVDGPAPGGSVAFAFAALAACLLLRAKARQKAEERPPSDSLYRLHDGQNRHGGGLLGGFGWFDLAEVVSQWRCWKDLLDRKALGDASTCVADPGVRSEPWNAKWIPITGDGSGDHHCVDLAPADGGHAGQIIKVWHDLEGRVLFAKSLSEWLETHARELESGERVYDEDYGALLRPEDI